MHVQCEVMYLNDTCMTRVISLHDCWHKWLSSSQENMPHSCRWKPKLARARSFPFTPVSWGSWHWNFQKVAKDRGRNSRNCCAGKLHCNRINHSKATGVAFFSFPFVLREWGRAWPKRESPDRFLHLNMKTNRLKLPCFKMWEVAVLSSKLTLFVWRQPSQLHLELILNTELFILL